MTSTSPELVTRAFGGLSVIVTTNLPFGGVPSAVTALALPYSPAEIS